MITLDFPVSSSYFPVRNPIPMIQKGTLKTELTEKLSKNILFEGFMGKRGSRLGNFKTRYFVLYEDHMKYYKDSHKKAAKGHIYLKNVKLDYEEYLVEVERKYSLFFIFEEGVMQLFVQGVQPLEKWIENLSKVCIIVGFERKFSIVSLIGRGTFGSVMNVCKRGRKEPFAAKIYENKTKIQKEKLAIIKGEIDILRSVGGVPQLPSLVEVHETKNSIVLIMTLMKGKSLSIVLESSRRLSEAKIKIIIRSLLELLSILKTKDIIHRDIKPANIIISKKGDSVSIVDFGLAVKKNDLKFEDSNSFCCTPGYSAPEILKEEVYDFGADMYSLGVVFYEIVYGRNPFSKGQEDDIISQNSSGKLRFHNEFTNPISRQGLELLKKMVEKDKTRRITPEEALKQPWFSEEFDKPDFTKAVKSEDLDLKLNFKCKSGEFEVCDSARSASIMTDFNDGHTFKLNLLTELNKKWTKDAILHLSRKREVKHFSTKTTWIPTVTGSPSALNQVDPGQFTEENGGSEEIIKKNQK